MRCARGYQQCSICPATGCGDNDARNSVDALIAEVGSASAVALQAQLDEVGSALGDELLGRCDGYAYEAVMVLRTEMEQKDDGIDRLKAEVTRHRTALESVEKQGYRCRDKGGVNCNCSCAYRCARTASDALNGVTT
jgi:hypothetical protein